MFDPDAFSSAFALTSSDPTPEPEPAPEPEPDPMPERVGRIVMRQQGPLRIIRIKRRG